MRSALKGGLERLRTLLLAAAATGAAHLGGQAHAAIAPGEEQLPSAAEQKTWAEAASSNSPDAYQRYLELFPTGRFAEAAFRSLIDLGSQRRPVASIVDIEPAAGPGAQPVSTTVNVAELTVY